MFNRKGFTLIEIVLAIFIIGVALVTLLSMFSMGLKGDVFAREMTIASTLAQELMEEIKSQEFEEPRPDTPVFGPETAGRTRLEPTVAAASDRTFYDDVDDYDNWSKSPPEEIDGTSLADFSLYTRSVEVRNVANQDYTSEQGDGTTDSKRVTVTISKGGNDLVNLTTVVVRY